MRECKSDNLKERKRKNTITSSERLKKGEKRKKALGRYTRKL